MRKITHLLFLTLVLIGTSVYAQVDNNTDNHTVTLSVAEVAIMDLESTGSLNFNLELPQPDEAGEIVADTTNSNTWLNYTSVVGNAESRNITVATDVAIPSAYLLTVTAGAASATGNGTKGTPGAAITLSTTAQNLITGIGSAYTASGASSGHQLTYTLSPVAANFGSLNHETDQAVVITYTITD